MINEYRDVVEEYFHILIEYPIDLPYIKTSYKFINKYPIYEYDNKRFIKLYDGDKYHMVYLNDKWENGQLYMFLNNTDGDWWSPKCSQ